jgi:hypothetical protein
MCNIDSHIGSLFHFFYGSLIYIYGGGIPTPLKNMSESQLRYVEMMKFPCSKPDVLSKLKRNGSPKYAMEFGIPSWFHHFPY